MVECGWMVRNVYISNMMKMGKILEDKKGPKIEINYLRWWSKIIA